MVLKKTDFQKEDKFNLPVSQSGKKKPSRLTVAILFLGTIILSSFLWFQAKFKNWRQQFFKPASFTIIKPQEESLEKFIGFKPDLKNLEALKKSIELLTNNLTGTYGIYFSYLKTNESLGINEDGIYTAASVNKIPIMVNFFQLAERGKVSEEDEYVLKSKDIQDYGTGQLRYQKLGSKYTYAKLVELSGKISDNTAAYVLENLVTRKTIQSKLDELKLKNTSIEDNSTTPKEMGQYLKLLFNDQLVSKANKDKILYALTDTDFEDRIPKGVPQGVKVAHKIGNEIQTINDCGIVYGPESYVLCILTKEVKEAEALEIIPKISRLVWEFVNK